MNLRFRVLVNPEELYLTGDIAKGPEIWGLLCLVLRRSLVLASVFGSQRLASARTYHVTGGACLKVDVQKCEDRRLNFKICSRYVVQIARKR